MSALKALARDWLPPALVSALRRNRLGGTRFEGPFDSWEAAAARSCGYDAGVILEKVLAATLAVQRGDAIFERDSILFQRQEYCWPVATALMSAAARDGGVLDVVDYGGSLGSSYFQYRPLHEPLASVRWNVIEQPHYVHAGRQFENQSLRFHETLPGCLRDNAPNIVLASSVLQYLREPHQVATALARAGARYVVIDRTPLTALERDILLVQHVDPAIYEASYPMWALSERRLVESLQPGYACLATFDSPEGSIVANGVRFHFKGMLLERRP